MTGPGVTIESLTDALDDLMDGLSEEAYRTFVTESLDRMTALCADEVPQDLKDLAVRTLELVRRGPGTDQAAAETAYRAWEEAEDGPARSNDHRVLVLISLYLGLAAALTGRIEPRQGTEILDNFFLVPSWQQRDYGLVYNPDTLADFNSPEIKLLLELTESARKMGEKQ